MKFALLFLLIYCSFACCCYFAVAENVTVKLNYLPWATVKFYSLASVSLVVVIVVVLCGCCGCHRWVKCCLWLFTECVVACAIFLLYFLRQLICFWRTNRKYFAFYWMCANTVWWLAVRVVKQQITYVNTSSEYAKYFECGRNARLVYGSFKSQLKPMTEDDFDWCELQKCTENFKENILQSLYIEWFS